MLGGVKENRIQTKVPYFPLHIVLRGIKVFKHKYKLAYYLNALPLPSTDSFSSVQTRCVGGVFRFLSFTYIY